MNVPARKSATSLVFAKRLQLNEVLAKQLLEARGWFWDLGWSFNA